MVKVEIDDRQLRSKLLRLLTKRDHSITELRQKMKRYYEFSAEDFSAALDWLKELKYLPDEAKLASRLTQHYRSQGRGLQWIRGKLRTKGLINHNLNNEDEELEAARIFLTKKLKGQSVSTLDFKEKQRLGRQLTSRGFSMGLVRGLLK